MAEETKYQDAVALREERTLTEGLLRIVGIVWRYRWFIVLVTAITAIGIVTYSIVSVRLPPDQSPLPNFYTANATLLMQRSSNQNVSQSIMASLGLQDTTGGVFDMGLLASEVLRSRSFLDDIVQETGIIDRYGVVHNPRTTGRAIVSGRSSFDFNPRARTLSISYTDTDPEFAASMVESMVNILMRWFAERGGTDRLVAIATLEEKLGEVETRIAEIQSRIEAFQLRYGVLQVEEIAQTQSQLLAGFRAQLLEIDLEIANRQRISRIANDPELALLGARRENLLDLISRVEQGYTGGAERLPARDQLPALAADYARLSMEFQIQSRLYQGLTERYEAAKLTADVEPAFTVLEPVEVPEEKSGPYRGQMSAMYTAGAFFGSVVLSLLLHWVGGVLKDPRNRSILSGQESK